MQQALPKSDILMPLATCVSGRWRSAVIAKRWRRRTTVLWRAQQSGMHQAGTRARALQRWDDKADYCYGCSVLPKQGRSAILFGVCTASIDLCQAMSPDTTKHCALQNNVQIACGALKAGGGAFEARNGVLKACSDTLKECDCALMAVVHLRRAVVYSKHAVTH
eukprot:1159396-Pelagomonas_calceolata.AAC.5